MNVRCGVRILIGALAAFAICEPVLARDGDILFTVRVRRAGASLRVEPLYRPAEDGDVGVGDTFTVEDYVAPHFRVPAGEHDEYDYYLRTADVEPVDSRPAKVRSKTPLFRSMAVQREIISYLDKGAHLEVLGKAPDLQACLVRTKAEVYGWVSCSAVDLTYERKGCYRLANDLETIEITIQPGTTLHALEMDTGEMLETLRKACRTESDKLLANGRCRLQLPYRPPRLVVVRKGDTLISISEQITNLTPQALQRWNCLSSTVLQPGQRLLVLADSY